MTLVIAYAVALVVFCTADATWLGIVARHFDQSQIGTLLLIKPNWVAAGLFYILFVAGIVIFAVRPAVAAHGILRAAVLGALFGLFTYGTYELTNLATLKGWTVTMAVIDLACGCFVTAAAARAGYAAGGLRRR